MRLFHLLSRLWHEIRLWKYYFCNSITSSGGIAIIAASSEFVFANNTKGLCNGGKLGARWQKIKYISTNSAGESFARVIIDIEPHPSSVFFWVTWILGSHLPVPGSNVKSPYAHSCTLSFILLPEVFLYERKDSDSLFSHPNTGTHSKSLEKLTSVTICSANTEESFLTNKLNDEVCFTACAGIHNTPKCS